MNRNAFIGTVALFFLIGVKGQTVGAQTVPDQQSDRPQSSYVALSRLWEWMPADNTGQALRVTGSRPTVLCFESISRTSYADLCHFYAEKAGLKDSNLTTAFAVSNGMGAGIETRGGNSTVSYTQFQRTHMRTTNFILRQATGTLTIAISNHKGDANSVIRIQNIVN